jgi:hypothetical protein
VKIRRPRQGHCHRCGWPSIPLAKVRRHGWLCFSCINDVQIAPRRFGQPGESRHREVGAATTGACSAFHRVASAPRSTIAEKGAA